MNVRDHNRVIDPMRNAMRGIVRRMVVSRAAAVIWQVAGVRFLDNSTETNEAEVFQGIGIFALPASDGAPEAIVLNVGGPNAPAIVATRDEKTRASVVPSDMTAGEFCVFGKAAIVCIRANGTVEIRTPAGAAVPLATKEDVRLLAEFVNGLFVGGTGSAVIPPNTVPRPDGTTVLMGM